MATMLSRSLASRAAPEVPEAAKITELLKKTVAMTRTWPAGSTLWPRSRTAWYLPCTT